MTETKIIVGGSVQEMAARFVQAWKDAEQSKAVTPERVLSFESWDGLASVLTPERYRLLRHLHNHPEPSVSALARALSRGFRRVHADVTALETAGLIERGGRQVRTTADRIQTEICL